MLDRKEIIQEIEKVKENFIGVKGALKTLKNRVRTLKSNQQELLKAGVDARQAAEDRDRAFSELDVIIDKIEEFKKACDNSNKMTYASKKDVLFDANKTLFDNELFFEE